MTPHDPTYEPVAMAELARLRRIESAAREVLERLDGGSRRSATPLLAAIAALRAALMETPPG